MPAVAYFFLDGPWRCCWVKYGYDPRADPTAKMYSVRFFALTLPRFQVIEMRSAHIQSLIDMFPSSLRKAAESTPEKYPTTESHPHSSPRLRHVFNGLHILTNMSQFQYVDLTFPPVHSLLSATRSFRDTCDVTKPTARSKFLIEKGGLVR